MSNLRLLRHLRPRAFFFTLAILYSLLAFIACTHQENVGKSLKTKPIYFPAP
jgi:hypothetical protein